MQCLNPFRIYKNISPREYPHGLEVPCGRCLQCRIKRKNEWVTRMIHEIGYHDKCNYITLTYNPEHVPDNHSLKKEDLQKFIKRLRKIVEHKIKYFACGEYGDRFDRPHYHAIIFGLGLYKEDKQLIRDAWSLQGKSLGHTHVGTVTPDSIRYVAKYIHKQYSGELEYTEYKNNNLETPFRLLSQGLGKEFAIENKEQIQAQGMCTLNGTPVSIPRYYIKKLDLDMGEIKKHAQYKSCELTEKITGINVEAIKLRRNNMKLYTKYKSEIKKMRKQNDSNLKAQVNLKDLQRKKNN